MQSFKQINLGNYIKSNNGNKRKSKRKQIGGMDRIAAQQAAQQAARNQPDRLSRLSSREKEEQFNQGGKNRALQKRRKKGPQWFEKPTANPIALAVRHLDKFAPIFRNLVESKILYPGVLL